MERCVVLRSSILAIATAVQVGVVAETPQTSNTRTQVDPADWGSQQARRGLPEYMTGDECLFCHREIGKTWHTNHHQTTLRRADEASQALRILSQHPTTSAAAKETQFLLGSSRHVRFLRKSGKYGQLELLSTSFRPSQHGSGKLVKSSDVSWQNYFADKCAGCHTTGVDAATRSFSSMSLDCFTCHGDVQLGHTSGEAETLWSDTHRQQADYPRQVVSACGQCHLRGGRSRSTGLPYPANFVAGDNLFRDFLVDWSDVALARMSHGESHIFHNVRDVALYGNESTTCLTCHDVHRQSTSRHQRLADAGICTVCHVHESDRESTSAGSVVCEY